MNWPPTNATEMLGLQKLYGSDGAIGDAIGAKQKSVQRYRLKLGVPPYIKYVGHDGLWWPPKTKEEMIGWLDRHGNDTRIGIQLGIDASTVQRWRRSFGLIPRRKRIKRPPREIGMGVMARLNEGEIAKLYAGRRYVDWGAVPVLETFKSKRPARN